VQDGTEVDSLDPAQQNAKSTDLENYTKNAKEFKQSQKFKSQKNEIESLSQTATTSSFAITSATAAVSGAPDVFVP
jgi:hypothetical protein